MEAGVCTTILPSKAIGAIEMDADCLCNVGNTLCSYLQPQSVHLTGDDMKKRSEARPIVGKIDPELRKTGSRSLMMIVGMPCNLKKWSR